MNWVRTATCGRRRRGRPTRPPSPPSPRSAQNRLFVALLDGEEVVGTFQLTFIPNLTGRGALRVKVESVKVKAGAALGRDRRAG